MIKKNLKYAVFLFLLILFTIKYSHLYAIFGIKPDLVLIFLLRRSINDPKPDISVVWAFSAGMISDILTGDVIGITSFAYSASCFFASYFKKGTIYLSPSKRVIIYIAAVLFSLSLIYLVSLSGTPLLNNIFYIILPSSVYTLIIAGILQSLKPTK